MKHHHFLSVNLFHFMNTRWNITADLLRIILTLNFLSLQNFITCFSWQKALSHKMYCLWWWAIYQVMRWMICYQKLTDLNEYICSQTTVNSIMTCNKFRHSMLFSSSLIITYDRLLFSCVSRIWFSWADSILLIFCKSFSLL